jgi:hypothetical protein
MDRLVAALNGGKVEIKHLPEPVENVFDLFNIPHKRGYYLLEKWDDKGWWEYGVSLRTGWFTSKAPDSLVGRK